jgi:AIG2-like family
LVFSKPAAPNQDGEGLANIELAPNEDASAEGVLYYLPAKAIAFLDLHEVAYCRTKLQLEQDGAPVEGYAYIAESPRAGLKPTRAYRDLLLHGAMEPGLSEDYKKQLREIPVLAPEGLRSVR